MLSILNNRMITGKQKTPFRKYGGHSKVINLESKPIITHITDQYIVIACCDDFDMYTLNIYSIATFKLVMEIDNLSLISHICEIRPGYIMFIETTSSKINIHEIKLDIMKHYQVLTQFVLKYPSFVEVTNNKNNSYLLLYCDNKYMLLDNNYETFWEHDNSDNNIININIVENYLLHIIKRPEKLKYMVKCNVKTKTGRICKKKSQFKQCHIHRNENHDIYCYLSDKVLYKYYSPPNCQFVETNGIFIFTLENNSKTLICNHLITGEIFNIEYSTDSRLMYISNKHFMIISNNSLIIYNDLCKPVYHFFNIDRTVYDIRNDYIAFLQHDTRGNYYINTVNPITGYMRFIKLLLRPRCLYLNTDSIILEYRRSVVIYDL